MENLVRIAKYSKSDDGFIHLGYNEYHVTYLSSNKFHILRIVVNGRITNRTVNLLNYFKSGYRNSILLAISDYKNNRIKDQSITKKKLLITNFKSNMILNNIKNYLLPINKEETRNYLTKYELI